MTAASSSRSHRVRDLVPWRRSAGLPPGQREIRVFPRFSDQPLKSPPRVSPVPELLVTGAVDRELRLPLDDVLLSAHRTEMEADFHCVTTWSTRGLRWEGRSFASFWHDVVVPTCGPDAGARCIVVEGLDGARAILLLEDALAPGVLLADRLDGAPLDATHGAPLRLVSPQQYGYKNVKHVHRIEVHLTPPPSRYGRIEHLRARVALEERHATVAGHVLRLVYRALVPITAILSERSLRKTPR